MNSYRHHHPLIVAKTIVTQIISTPTLPSTRVVMIMDERRDDGAIKTMDIDCATYHSLSQHLAALPNHGTPMADTSHYPNMKDAMSSTFLFR
jgi:hypothetical protein